MSDGYRNGAFALGLATGGGIVLNLVLWSAYRANNTRKTVPQGQENAESHPWIEPWDWFVSTFFIADDTLAQWAMALLSLAAVYLLWETLKASRKTLVATQKMAIDAKKVGEAQVSAHISVTQSSVQLIIEEAAGTKRAGYSFKFTIKNNGQTTAFNIGAYVTVAGLKGREMWEQAKPSDLDPNATGIIRLTK